MQWEVVRFLVEHDLWIRLFEPLVTLYQGRTVNQIKDNPYRLLSFTTWENTDRVAMLLGVDKQDNRRLSAGVIATLQKYLVKGHTAEGTDSALISEATIGSK